MHLSTFQLILLLIPIVKGSVFGVPYKLLSLFKAEEKLINPLQMNNLTDTQQTYIDRCNYRFHELSPRNINEIDSDESQSLILKLLVGNPLHVFSLLRRLVINLPNLLTELKSTTVGELVTTLLEDVDMPGELDLEGGSQTLARIQFSFRLNPEDIASGLVSGHQTAARLSVEEMLDIALRRASGTHPIRPNVGPEFALAIEWAETALKIVKKSEYVDELYENKIDNLLKLWKDMHNRKWRSPIDQRGNLPNEAFFMSNIEDDKTGRELRTEEANWQASGQQALASRLDQGYNIHDFYALCRGEKVEPSTAPLIGRCILTDQGDPYFFLSPLKVEIISEKSSLKMYHGVITDNELRFMTETIAPKLQAASVVTGKEGAQGVSNERTQSHGWLWDQEDVILLNLAKRVARFTGLKTHRPLDQLLPESPIRFVEAEAWQMGLYGPGGHYLPHYDAFDEELNMMPSDIYQKDLNDLWVGNRIATVMFYLSDVVGGATVFPNMGVAATPTKGSAVFWHNLHQDGRRDDKTLHGACPTLLGVKWVSNKWIREGSQIWKRPCGIEQNCESQLHC